MMDNDNDHDDCDNYDHDCDNDKKKKKKKCQIILLGDKRHTCVNNLPGVALDSGQTRIRTREVLITNLAS